MTIAISALLLISFAAPLPAVSRPSVELPEAVLAHPAGESTPSPSAPPAAPRWFTQGLEAWGRPQPPREGLYDERYITW
jgi:hypothetical protein